MKICTTEMGYLRAWFDGRPGPFDIAPFHCCDPNGPYSDLLLEFEEIREEGSPLPDPFHFLVLLDLASWTDKPLSGQGGAAGPLVGEFLRDLTDERKGQFQEDRERYRRGVEKLAAATIPVRDIREGAMAPYAELIAGDGCRVEDWAAYCLPFVHEGEVYVVEDLYCPNPRCNCLEAMLQFLPPLREAVGSSQIRPLFTAILPLGPEGGEGRVDFLDTCSQARAEEFLALWQQDYSQARPALRARQKAIREVGRRSLRAEADEALPAFVGDRFRLDDVLDDLPARGGSGRRTAPPEGTIVRDGPKTRPNQPCPCGSGKKYKKCCGRDAR